MSIAPVVSNSLLERLPGIRSQTLALAFSAALLSILSACGGGSTPQPPAPQVAIQISPPSGGLAIFATAKAQFTATVSGTGNPAVSWSVAEAGGGTIDTTGLYTAPAVAGTFHVIAMAQADTTKTASLAATVTVGKPTFSSTPPIVALEGNTYSYTLAANDPAGTGVTFALQGPEGAVVSGNSLTWTPAAAQSRAINTFTVTATTAAGGVETQSWSVTPNGTVRISDIDKYWSVNEEGELHASPHPTDLSDATMYDIAALLPQEDGSVVEIKGVGNTDGTATIASVPAGNYWLQIRPHELYWTNSSTFDYRSDYVGRAPGTAINTTMAWDLSNLAPWDTSLDSLLLQVPNAGVVDIATSAPDDGAVSYQGTEPYKGPPVDGGEGDAAYILQRRHQSISAIADVVSVASMAAVAELELKEGDDPGTVSASLSPLSSAKTLELEVESSAYTNWAHAVNPNFNFSGGVGELSLQPMVTDRVAQGSVPLLDFTLFDVSADQDLGSFNYGSPFPSRWPLLFSYSQGGRVTAAVPDGQGGTIDLWASVTHVGTSLPGEAKPDQPAMSPVQDPQINGVSLFAATSASGPAVLTWTAPTGSVPVGYSIAVDPVEKDEYGYYLGDGIDLFTTSTTMKIPTGLLASSKLYVITITAMADAIANLASAPWRSGYPIAMADAVSGVVNYSEVGAAAQAVRARTLRSPRPAFARTRRTSERLRTLANLADLQYRRSHAQRAMALESVFRRAQSSPSKGTR